MMRTIKTYHEMILLPTYEERLAYLKLDGVVGQDTFAFSRYLNQNFYHSTEWKQMRDKIILRDYGCDLGIADRPISGRILIHHLNPLTIDDVKDKTDFLLNPNYLICVSNLTHEAIHYGKDSFTELTRNTERMANDTCPWRK